MDTTAPSTKKDGSYAFEHERAVDTIVDGVVPGTVPLPPVAKTSPLTKPLAVPTRPAGAARLAKTVVDASPLTYAVHEPGASIPAAPRRTRDDENEEALARDRNRKHLGLAAIGIATVTALTIAYFASSDDGTTARVENTSASVAAAPASAAPAAAAAPPTAPTAALTMTPTPGMGPAFTPVAPLPKAPPGSPAHRAAPRPTTPLQRTR